MNVSLNFTHLPPFPEYTLDLSGFHQVYGPMRPVSMEGAVIAITRIMKYTQGARFLCTDDDCPGSTGKLQKEIMNTCICGFPLSYLALFKVLAHSSVYLYLDPNLPDFFFFIFIQVPIMLCFL